MWAVLIFYPGLTLASIGALCYDSLQREGYIMLKKLFGDRAFLKKVLLFAIPIIVQNSITTFVSLLDNIMVGQVGTVQMSGVSVANQLIMVFNLCVFGATSGAGIFTAQFHGSGDTKSVQYTIRYKLYICLALVLAVIGIFIPFGKDLIELYLQGEGDPEAARLTLSYGYDYLKVMLIGFIPFALSNLYASSLRETGESIVPMYSGITAVAVNLIFNYILIFGHFGAPAMGVVGAAVATVLSRYVELLILVIWTHTHTGKCTFAKGLFRSLYLPFSLAKRIFIKGMPLLANEFLWSSGMAFLSQCYSTCGLDVVPAINISETINNLASVFAIAIATTVGILMGQMMGANLPKEQIKADNAKLLNLAIIFGVLFGLLLALIAPVFPLLYNTTDTVRTLATQLIFILAIMKPWMAYLMCVYYSMRSGGKTITTFLYDAGIMWTCSIPLAFCLSRFTDLPIIPLFLICQSLDIAKAILGFFIIRRGNWIQNLSRK